MTIADDITREVVFTDYGCSDDARIEVVVMMHNGNPVAMVRIPLPSGTVAQVLDDLREPDLLRSYEECLNAAADEMERMAR